jgi:phage shock protein E
MTRNARFRSRLAAASVAGIVALSPLTMAACSSADSAQAASYADEVAAGAVLVDVRTPAEFAEGHLDGAVNIDIQSPGFDAQITQLDPSATYLVYCRSGNRSGQALTRMQAAGFTDVANLGSVAEASAASGVAVVR